MENLGIILLVICLMLAIFFGITWIIFTVGYQATQIFIYIFIFILICYMIYIYILITDIYCKSQQPIYLWESPPMMNWFLFDKSS
jgi:hypothetical protein